MKDQNVDIQICQVTRRNMQFSLMWPGYGEEVHPKKWHYAKVIAFLLICSIMPLSTLMHLIMGLKNNLDIYVAEDIAVITSMSGIWYMATIYVRHQPAIAALLRNLSSFDTFGKPPNAENVNKRMNFWSWFAFLYPTFGSTSINFSKLLLKSKCEAENEKNDIHEQCGLMYPFWIPFNINYFPLFHFLFLYIWISATLFVRLHLSLCFQALEISQHIILRINHLAIMIEESLKDSHYTTSRKKLTKCILYHQQIIEFSVELDKSFSDLMFVHFVMTASICGCFEKQFIDQVQPMSAVVHLIGWIVSLLIASLGGQQLVDASKVVTEVLYGSSWYNGDVRLQKDILFMLLRSQKGLYITVGSFGILSYPFFASVMKMSYSVFAMLTS